MANVKISELPAATVPLAGSELVPIVQSGTTDQVTVANLTAGRTVSAAAVTATGTVSGATVTASGTVSGATVTASGTVSGATVSGTTVTATGTVSGATVTASGAVSGATVTASGAVSGATVTASGAVSGVTAVVGAGTAVAPAISPTGDTNTGIYFPGADRIGFTEGGVQAGEFDANGNFLFNSGFGSVARAFGCRAWVNFDGTGTVAIRASGNVSSITDNGTGDYTVNFTTAMPDANYNTVISISGLSGNTGVAFYPATQLSGLAYASIYQTTSSIRGVSVNGSGANIDCAQINLSIFR